MRYRSNSRRIHHIDIFFVLVLFGVMALSLVTVITLGANVYSKTADLMQHNYETRTTLGYVSGKIRQCDSRGAVETDTIDGVSVLKLRQEINGSTYMTYICCYDGYLCEFFAAEDLPFSPQNAQRLVAVTGFSAEKKDGNLLELTVTDTSGESSKVLISSRCN